jgi:hypothetical protein
MTDQSEIVAPMPARRERFYNVDEIKVLNSFKSDYLTAPSAKDRKNIVSCLICPALMLHWQDIGRPVLGRENIQAAIQVRSHNSWIIAFS